MSRRGQHVDAEGLHVDIEVSGALRRVENEQPPSLVGEGGDFLDRRHAASDVGDMRNDDIVDAISAEFTQVIKVDAERRRRFHERHLRPVAA